MGSNLKKMNLFVSIMKRKGGEMPEQKGKVEERIREILNDYEKNIKEYIDIRYEDFNDKKYMKAISQLTTLFKKELEKKEKEIKRLKEYEDIFYGSVREKRVLEIKNEQIAKLKAGLEKKGKEMKDLRIAYEGACEHIQSWKTKTAELLTRIATLQSELKESGDKRDVLTKGWKDECIKSGTLQSENEELKRTDKKSRESIWNASVEIVNFKKENEDLKKELKKRLNQIESMRECLQNYI